jgi:hypothetical protein
MWGTGAASRPRSSTLTVTPNRNRSDTEKEYCKTAELGVVATTVPLVETTPAAGTTGPSA